ncbi:DUF3015 family protein [Aquirhabdus sp.]|uniref:DUF3015 family protein n=1 Tax=Aquirhabdus sp. TaxID=2824160 RepID=UPI00396C6042
MMKKLIVAAVLVACSSAAMADNDIGCGLGTQVWAGQKGLGPKVLGATTNGTFGNQTFGITFGTLGCRQNGVVTASARLGEFMGNNQESLARDMSVGQGESLNVLANLIGIKEQDKTVFFNATKTNFATIYAANNQTTGQVLAALQSVMAQDATLSAYKIA